MLIYFATVFNPKDVHAWSGLCFYIRQMLNEQGHDVRILENLRIPNAFMHKAKKHAYKYLGKTYSPYFALNVAKAYARQIKKSVPEGSIIFSPNTILLSQLGKAYTKVLYTDSTFDALLDFYPSYSNISKSYIEQAREIERQALSQADLVIYTSQWAANTAIDIYNVHPKKISIVPFGSNMDIQIKDEELKPIIESRIADEELQLLFIAASWYRKGGDYALMVLNRLNKMGIKAKLHVVGLKKLPSHIDKTNIIDHGFISKSSKEGQDKMASLFKEAHYLLLPSRADCTPVSVSEANSFGLPCLLSHVGGNSDIVIKDINGRTFDFTKGSDACVNFIASYKASPAMYEQLCNSSFQIYKDELNWKTTGKRITNLLNTLSSGKPVEMSAAY